MNTNVSDIAKVSYSTLVHANIKVVITDSGHRLILTFEKNNVINIGSKTHIRNLQDS